MGSEQRDICMYVSLEERADVLDVCGQRRVALAREGEGGCIMQEYGRMKERKKREEDVKNGCQEAAQQWKGRWGLH